MNFADGHNGLPEQTDWTMVFSAGSADPAVAAAAISLIYRRYVPAVFSWARLHTPLIEDARDLTQEFFAFIIRENWFSKARRERGKFRNFMLITLQNFARDLYRRAAAGKRGGQALHVSIHWDEVRDRLEAAGAQSCSPDAAFRRGWAAVVMEDSLDALRRKYEKADKLLLFETLAPWLPISEEKGDYAQAVSVLQLSPEAARAAVSRLKQDYRSALWTRVAEDLNTTDPAEIRAELESLIQDC